MLPPRVAAAFEKVPGELVGLCRPHTWEELTTPPGADMRPIRDVLVHLLAAEGFWIGHVIQGHSRPRPDLASFTDLDSILGAWAPQRQASLALLHTLEPAERLARRPLPWDLADHATIEEIIWHVVTHEHYHRGQVFTRLALLGRRNLPDHDLLRSATSRPSQ